MTTNTTNGQIRKTLARQLDRLDSILDGLSDGLNEAVEAAVERAVKQAVGEAVRETLQAVIAEVVSNPDLLAAARTLLAPASTADVPTDPPKSLFRRACDGAKAGLAVAATACTGAGAYVAKQAAAVKSTA